MNKLSLIGHLGRDPEMRYTPSGESVTSFSVATNRRYKTASGEQHEETTWFDVSAWGKLAEIANRLTKGERVYIEGPVTLAEYATKDGAKRSSMSVRLATIEFLGARPERPDDDLPF